MLAQAQHEEADAERASLQPARGTGAAAKGGSGAGGPPPLDSEPPSLAVDLVRERFPFSIVWTPIPVLTWLALPVGHMGIADSRGVIYDFAGPYTISVDNMSFGKTTRYLQLFSAADALRPERVQAWDDAVRVASEVYAGRMHNLCWDNCHSHVGLALNRLKFKGFQYWGMGVLAMWMFFAGSFVSPARALWTVLPSAVIYGFIALVCVL